MIIGGAVVSLVVAVVVMDGGLRGYESNSQGT